MKTLSEWKRPAVLLFLFGLSLCFRAWNLNSQVAGQRRTAAWVSIVQEGSISPGAAHGLSVLREALEQNGNSLENVPSSKDGSGDFLLVIGEGLDSPSIKELIGLRDRELATADESFLIRRAEIAQKPSIIVLGSKERGLMYGLMEVAEHVVRTSNVGNPFVGLRETLQTPHVTERALSKAVMNQSEFESYFFSEEYWNDYFSMLARNRFSTFVLLFGYSAAGYFDPPYPFLFDVPAFPEVAVSGLSDDKKRKNLRMLQRIVKMAKERGLDFTIAIWTHIHRARGAGLEEGVVHNLTGENLIPYTRAALKEFLRLIPDIDALQFRVHVESSLTLPEQVEFWSSVLASVKEVRPDIRIDMRVKGFTDDMIDAALASGLNVRLDTKYWGEQMGLPYHPTHLTTRNQFKRRHGYADLLRYPPRYKMHYRLWNLGTTRILQWADPDYVKRFAATTHLWEGDGFEVHEPLAFKMAHQRGTTFELLKPPHRYYRWEFERYWPFFQTFGRVSYDPEVAETVLASDFEKRFGRRASPSLRKALYAASQIVPRIVAYNLSDLSADHTWAEKQRWEDLPVYVWAEPSDTAQFLGIEEAARYHLENRESARIWPQQTSQWFSRVSREVRNLVGAAEQQIGENRSKEFESLIVDLKVLAGLADYHSKRIHAGLNFAFFEKTQNILALERAIHWEKEAIGAWRELVALTRDVYADDIVMGRTERLQGNWGTELAALEKGLEKLEAMQQAFEPDFREVLIKFDFGDGPVAEGFEPVASQYQILYPWLPWDRATNYDRVQGGYGWLHSFLSSPPALKSGKMEREELRDFVSGPDPTEYSYSSFGADVPSGHYELTFTMSDQSVNPQDWGPMWIVANGLDSTGPFEVPAGEEVTMKLLTTVTDDRLNVVFNSNSNSRWLVNSMEVARLEPTIAHVPVRRVQPGDDLKVQAMICGPDSILQARVAYRQQSSGFRFLDMTEESFRHYSATIPASTRGRILYFIEATDKQGRVITYPRRGRGQPIQVEITEDTEPPLLQHEPPDRWPVGQALPIRVAVQDESSVKWVRLRYRGVSQHQDFRTLELLPDDSTGEFRAEIPGAHIRPEWDLMYYIEVMDGVGNGKIYPDLEYETPYHVVELER